MPPSLDNLRTAGVFVRYHGRFPFQVGPNEDVSGLGVVRLGGHIEAGESPVEAAVREVLEEASITVDLLSSPVTYYQGGPEAEPERIEGVGGEGIRPVLISGDREHPTSVMYLAEASTCPHPGADSKGLVLLNAEEIARVCERPTTLDEFLAAGGLLIENVALDRGMELVPRLQLRFLHRLLYRHAAEVLWGTA